MSKETRTIRPFLGLDDLSDVLDESLLHFGREPCLANSGITVDLQPHEFLLRPVSIEWAADEAAFQRFKKHVVEGVPSLGLVPDDLSLVVIASSAFLKLANLVFTHSVSKMDELKRVVDLTERDRAPAFSAPFTGFTVDAYLLLTRSLPPQSLRPHLKGTWIASSRFRVDTTQGPAVLPPTPLTDEVRERYRLPARTVRYIYFGDHDVTQPSVEQEDPVFYIDEKLLAQLNARRTSRASKAVQLQLVLDFVSAVVRRASALVQVDDVGWEDVRMSLLGSVVGIAAGPGASDTDRERLMDAVRTNPDYVIARAEHFIDVGAGLAGILEGSDT